MSVALILVIASFVCTILAAIGKCPLWVAVLLIDVVLLLGALPALR